MLPIIYIADVHFTSKKPQYRTDDYAATALRKFRFILEQADKYGGNVLIGGDLLDKPSIKPELLNAIIKEIFDFDASVISIAGQHDQSFHNPDLRKSSYGTLIAAEAIIHIDNERELLYQHSHIYGRSWGEPYPTPHTAGTNILVAHETVTKGEPPPWLSARSAEQMIEEHPGFDYILTGDFHDKFVVTHNGCTLVNSGPMLRSSIDKRDYEPACWLINDDGVTEIPIPIEEDVFDLGAVNTTREESDNSELEARIEEFLESLGVTADKPSFDQIVNKGLETINDNKLKNEIMEVMDYVRQN
jgi:DNA repair exonuclease SbcCD nuclease subunit